MDERKENRRAAYYDVLPYAPNRRWHIVRVLRHHPEGMTAEDITMEMIADGIIPRYSENAVRPRLTELSHDGVVVAIGHARSERSRKNVTVWKLANKIAAPGVEDRKAAHE